ncbi:hypothetical protein [Candidatus Collinsella stercoripullorum]|uniref:hypothetical protein n=1 Tax=Candidatus Collinsella stercoripullorum TaxID=2838522 RepID=UPI0022E8B82E|nr:hypothetical protein [Candidatus Collinsella stercoripullorum]
MTAQNGTAYRPTSYHLPQWCLALGVITCPLIIVLWLHGTLDPSTSLFLELCAALFLGIHLLFRTLEKTSTKKHDTCLAMPELRLGIPLATMVFSPLLFAAFISLIANYCTDALPESEESPLSLLSIANLAILLLWIELGYSIEKDSNLQPEHRCFAIATLSLVSSTFSYIDTWPMAKSLAEFIGSISALASFLLAAFELIRSKIRKRK